MGNKKIKYSGYPPEIKTNEEKLKFCERVNKEMNYKEDSLKLTLNNVEFNSVQRNVSKEGLNSILGKMSQGKVYFNVWKAYYIL